MTRNQDLKVLHVKNASAFAGSLPTRIVTGDTLIFDFIYFLHPVGAPPLLWMPLRTGNPHHEPAGCTPPNSCCRLARAVGGAASAGTGWAPDLAVELQLSMA